MTIAYALHALLRGFAGMDTAAARATFAAITGDAWTLAGFHLAFMAATVAIVARGIENGIEAACRVLMPLLMLLILALAGYAMVVGELGRALEFLLVPRRETLTARAALEALGLGFFSIGVGLGVAATYAAHAAPGTPLGLVAGATVVGDTVISILAALAVMPLVFAAGLDPAEGMSLMFLTLPIAFAGLPLGDWVGFAFFLALFAAALASAIGLLQLAVAPLMRRTGWSRGRAALVLGLGIWALGLPSMLSFNAWQAVRPLGGIPGFEHAGILEALDHVCSNLLLPVCGLLIAVFAGHVMAGSILREELGWPPRRLAVLRALLRWGVPVLILGFLVLGVLPP